MADGNNPFEAQLASWSEQISQVQPLAVQGKIARRHLGVQYDLAMEISGLLSAGLFHGRGVSSSLMFNAFLSNLYHLWASADLTCKGYYGSVRPILRLVFEGLLIAKFCSTCTGYELYDRWEKGEPISLGRDVFGRIKKPMVPELRELWKTLCSVTHFSTFAGQPTLELHAVQSEGRHNYSIIFMLLVMNDHLLRMHIVDRRLTYFMDRYSENDGWRRLRTIATMVAGKVRGLLRKASRAVVREYIARWHIV
jgi:hypothetical protein